VAIESNSTMPSETRVSIRSDADIVTARQQGRALAGHLGFTGSDLTVIATAISELGRNILTYAGSGDILLQPAHAAGKRGIVVVARDEGPGIPDIALAMQDSYSTSNSLGLGLPGTRRLMDEFTIDSVVGRGTTVVVKKWV
jgi:serine/threonine-protein kinase RsbT